MRRSADGTGSMLVLMLLAVLLFVNIFVTLDPGAGGSAEPVAPQGGSAEPTTTAGTVAPSAQTTDPSGTAAPTTDPTASASGVVFTSAELQQITDYYSEAAFVGDSLLQGFHNYVNARKDASVFSSSVFLAAYSFSSHNNNAAITEKSKHPFYKGQRRKVQDSLTLAGSKRVFICLWANEILATEAAPAGNLSTTYADYTRMVEAIKEKNPGIEVFIVSPQYMWTAGQTEHINNKNFDALRILFQDVATKTGAQYIDLGRYIGNAEDGMYERYSFDQYVHITDDAYDVWSRVLMDYALGRTTDPAAVAYPGRVVLTADQPESEKSGAEAAYELQRFEAGNGTLGAELAAEILAGV